jgi:lysophospholipase L1-like esterase
VPLAPASPPARRPHSWRRRLLLAAFGCAVGLFLCEGGARGIAYARQQHARSDWERLGGPREHPRAAATLGDMVRISDDPRVVYELQPGACVEFQGQECRINSLGFRGPEWPARARARGSLRILGLGDSVMFGWGVREQDCFLRVLERELAQSRDGRPVEVLNTGVPGYNTAMEVAAFERLSSQWQPDVVLLDYVGNDACLPNLIAGSNPWVDWRHSYLVDLLRVALGRASRRCADPLQPAPSDGVAFESDPDRVPEQYRDMVGEPGVEKALRRLRDLSVERHFHLLVASHHGVPDFVQRICADLGVPLVLNLPGVVAWLEQHGQHEADYRRSELVFSFEDPHPTALAHQRYAATLADFLRKSGWLEQ